MDLCTRYYDLDKPTAPPGALDFYLEHARNANGAIFEPMCGTGRFLIPILERGFDIEGADASPQMLAVCREKCRARKLDPKLIRGDKTIQAETEDFRVRLYRHDEICEWLKEAGFTSVVSRK